MSGAGFDSDPNYFADDSNYSYWAPDESADGRGIMTAATYNPLSGFENIVEAESILPWLYAEDEESNRRIDRNYIDELFSDQPAPFYKQLPTVNVYGGFAGRGDSGIGNVYETTGGGGDWYSNPGISTSPTSDLWGNLGGGVPL